MTFKSRDPFFVQERPRGVWHVENPEDPEVMLCGVKISVHSNLARIQTSWGVKPCLWCKHEYEQQVASFQSSTPSPESSKTSRKESRSRWPVPTTSSGRTT